VTNLNTKPTKLIKRSYSLNELQNPLPISHIIDESSYLETETLDNLSPILHTNRSEEYSPQESINELNFELRKAPELESTQIDQDQMDITTDSEEETKENHSRKKKKTPKSIPQAQSSDTEEEDSKLMPKGAKKSTQLKLNFNNYFDTLPTNFHPTQIQTEDTHLNLHESKQELITSVIPRPPEEGQGKDLH
jgi:hypothetical protein